MGSLLILSWGLISLFQRLVNPYHICVCFLSISFYYVTLYWFWVGIVTVKMGPSVSDTAWGKLSLNAKALKEGGFEALYKDTFSVLPGEHLKKTFACYLSTATGPVAGTLYLSNLHIAFCSDRPLSFTAPSGQQAWSYYKVVYITILQINGYPSCVFSFWSGIWLYNTCWG